MNGRTLRLPIVIGILILTLAGCGRELTPTPTAIPTTTPEPATPVGLTAGVLADRIAEGWKTIDRYRSITTTRLTHTGTPDAIDSGTEVIEEVILPDRRRQLVTVDGIEQSEIIVTGGNIYGKGPALPGITQPNRNPDSWITITGNVLGPENTFTGFYHSLLLPSQPPYAGLSESTRTRPAEELGTIEIGDRSCQQYRLIDTSSTGERLVILLSLSDTNLVCAIETTSNDAITTTLFEYDQPTAIMTPASPVAAPAENG